MTPCVLAVEIHGPAEHKELGVKIVVKAVVALKVSVVRISGTPGQVIVAEGVSPVAFEKTVWVVEFVAVSAV